MYSSLLLFCAIYCHHRILVLVATILVTIIHGITAGLQVCQFGELYHASYHSFSISSLGRQSY